MFATKWKQAWECGPVRGIEPKTLRFRRTSLPMTMRNSCCNTQSATQFKIFKIYFCYVPVGNRKIGSTLFYKPFASNAGCEVGYA